MTLSISRPGGHHASGHRDITETAAERANMGFNPANDPVIDEIKTLTAALYSICEGIIKDEECYVSDKANHAKREAATAMTQLQSAAMFAVQARARSF